jgi:hypothetical protein|tara:strand:+ start:120 stop:1457 length:1338 start_codon:yes stop_codon:yes gene_type:complete
MANTAKQKLFELIDDMTGMSTIPMEYGGGLDAAYMSLSDRRSNAFADPNANTAFDSPTSKNGLPTIYREEGGGMDDDYTESDLADAGFDEGDFNFGVDSGNDTISRGVPPSEAQFIGSQVTSAPTATPSDPIDYSDGGADLPGYAVGLDTLDRLGIVGPNAPADGGILGNYIDPNQKEDEEAKVGQYRQGTFLDDLVAGTTFGRIIGVGDNPKEKGVFVSDEQLDRNPDYDKDDAKVDQARNNLGNTLTQVAQQARQEAEDKIGDRGISPMNEKEFEEVSPDEAAKNAVSKAAADIIDDYKEYADLSSPYKDLGALGFIAPGGTALAGLSAIANAARDFFGVVGGGKINGRDVHVHSDGTISFVSPEDEPGYQNTDNDSGNDQLPRRRIAQAPTPVAASTTATEEPKTGMAALLARRRPAANRLDTLADLQEKFQKIYNRPFRTV